MLQSLTRPHPPGLIPRANKQHQLTVDFSHPGDTNTQRKTPVAITRLQLPTMHCIDSRKSVYCRGFGAWPLAGTCQLVIHPQPGFFFFFRGRAAALVLRPSEMGGEVWGSSVQSVLPCHQHKGSGPFSEGGPPKSRAGFEATAKCVSSVASQFKGGSQKHTQSNRFNRKMNYSRKKN